MLQVAVGGYSGSHGPDDWHHSYPVCGSGTNQSPIDIPRAGDQAGHVTYDANMTPFSFQGYDNVNVSGLTIKNNGHTAQVSITEGTSTRISGGGLNGTYVALQLHFHWGPDDHSGSEHTFRGRKYPLEMHIVHYKEAYGDVATALNHSDGLAVLGVFFVIDEDHQHADQTDKLAPLVAALGHVQHKDQTAAMETSFSNLLPAATDEFYRYQGSLTTPSCNEAVVWTVFENKNYITHTQMQTFRALSEDVSTETIVPLLTNFRPTQNLAARTVYKNYKTDVPHSFHWGYHGHEDSAHWPDYYSTCSGTQQSPVNIPADDVVKFNRDLQTLKMINYDKMLTGTMQNNGHTIQIDIENEDIAIEGGGLPGRYRAAQFHYHWGVNSEVGSENLRNGRAYPMEVHIVHYREKYGDLVSALGQSDGLAVVGFFFQIGIQNSQYDGLVSQLTDVQFKGDSTAFSGMSLESLTTSHIDPPLYFRYQGGLTTPPCLQIVTWSVMMNAIPIGAQQMAEFRKMAHIGRTTLATLHEHDYIGKNYRPPQSLGSRVVYSSYDFSTDTSAATSHRGCVLGEIALACLLSLFMCIR